VKLESGLLMRGKGHEGKWKVPGSILQVLGILYAKITRKYWSSNNDQDLDDRDVFCRSFWKKEKRKKIFLID